MCTFKTHSSWRPADIRNGLIVNNPMIVFPNAKINIGLRILRRRGDGYHDIESVFYPVQLCDMLEILPSGTGFNDEKPEIYVSGLDAPASSSLSTARALSAGRGI